MIYLPIKLKSILINTSKNSDIEEGFILVGTLNKIKRIFKITNKNNSNMSIRADPKEILCIEKYCDDNKLELMGFFHSHLYSTASPSRKDIELMKSSSQLWIIYSKLNNNMFAFTYKDKLESIEIFTIDTQKL